MDLYDDFTPNAANHVPLTPISFLRRTATIFPNHEAIIHGQKRLTWGDVFKRCRRLASALNKLGVGRNDTVSVIAPNIPEMVEAHFGIPASGGVLNAINTRLDAETVAYILEHGEAKILIVDNEYAPLAAKALAILDKNQGGHQIKVIDLIDSEYAAQIEGEIMRVGEMSYDELLSLGDEDSPWRMPQDEWDSLALNYTSGTSGRPKGVVYHHRGGHLIALGTATDWQLPRHPKYLYVVPMFHCNGWGHAWAIAAVAGTIVCSRTITAKVIYDSIADQNVTHFAGAPIVMSMLVNAEDSDRRPISQQIEVLTAGAAPPPTVLHGMEKLGFNITQVYGLTETYGHVVMSVWQGRWAEVSADKRAALKARQGVVMTPLEDIDVIDPDTGEAVAMDGETIGEIVMRGNVVMKGYLKNREATETAFKDGYFHSGDLGVKHPDGYVEIKDRLKDIIISGGENIASIEVEAALYRHEAVALVAVVAMPDEKWGEVPCAFIELKDGKTADEAEVIEFCRQHMAGYKRPKRVIFTTLPKTSTGKIQKFELRQRITEDAINAAAKK